MKIKYIFLLFLSFFLVTIIISYIDSQKELGKAYNFIITKIELTPTKLMIFYNKDEEVFFNNFRIIYYEDVRIGDKIVKEKNSKVLKIFRKNKDGVYEKHLEFYSNNVI
jgi:hypothetical protein